MLLSVLAMLVVVAAAWGGQTTCSLLRSVEAAFGVPFLGHAGDPATLTIPAVADASPGAA